MLNMECYNQSFAMFNQQIPTTFLIKLAQIFPSKLRKMTRPMINNLKFIIQILIKLKNQKAIKDKIE